MYVLCREHAHQIYALFWTVFGWRAFNIDHNSWFQDSYQQKLSKSSWGVQYTSETTIYLYGRKKNSLSSLPAGDIDVILKLEFFTRHLGV